MKSFLSVVVVLCSSVTTVATSQSTEVSVNANLPSSQQGRVVYDKDTVTMMLRGHKISVSNVQSMPDLPLHIVFVLDSGVHQQRMVQLEHDYVLDLAKEIRNSSPTFTVIAAEATPRTLGETKEATGLSAFIQADSKPAQDAKQDSADLYAGVKRGIELLSGDVGFRTLVILSDDDDDISGRVLSELREKMASNRVRCYSILLAQHDFYGTKAHSAWGTQLDSLASFSGGVQFNTNWQARESDVSTLKSIAQRISYGSLVTGVLDKGLGLKPGSYTMDISIPGSSKKFHSGPFLVSR